MSVPLLQNASHIPRVTPRHDGVPDPRELRHLALTGNSEMVHGLFRTIPRDDRSRYAHKYILSEVIRAGIRKLHRYLAASAEVHAMEEKEFIDGTVMLFIDSARTGGSPPRELFDSLLDWSAELIQLSLLPEASALLEHMVALGSNRFPDLHVRTLLSKARIMSMTGDIEGARSILRSLATRPYAIPDRNLLPEVILNLGKESLMHGEVAFYKMLLFRSLRLFYTGGSTRRACVNQIAATYRRSYRVLLDRQTPLSDRILFAVHRLLFRIEDMPLCRFLGVSRLAALSVLGMVYAANYAPGRPPLPGPVPSGQRTPGRAERRHILVTRAMGGIGDLLMLTPGLHALKQQRPHDEIHLAIPQRYFAVFEANPDVKLIDVEGPAVDASAYRRWFDFTDCPAARTESRTAPRVRRSRIQIFARALGIGLLKRRTMDRRPRYTVLPEERLDQEEFWHSHGLTGKTVVGVQFRADEEYRNYPLMAQLVRAMANLHTVLVFDADPIEGCDFANVIKVQGLSLRRAFARAAACDLVIAPDSSFVHLAGALDIPCIALYGPIDGAVRTREYPRCTYIDVRSQLGCIPCWRNEQTPCRLTALRGSVCLADIDVRTVVDTAMTILTSLRQI